MLEDYPSSRVLAPALLEMKVRWFIFIIIGASAGLPALAWTLSELIHHRKNGRRISVFIILLLLTDIVELTLSPYILMWLIVHDVELLWCTDWTCWFFWTLWWSSRVCGLLLNQLVALEGILSVRYPLYTAAVFSSAWFRIFYIQVLLCLNIGSLFLNERNYFWYPLSVFIVSVITWLICLGASCSAECHSHTSRKADRHIVVLLMFSLLVLYLPLTILSFLLFPILSSPFCPVWFIPVFLMSVRLISDPLLCVLVCRQSLRLQSSSQNPEETVVQSE